MTTLKSQHGTWTEKEADFPSELVGQPWHGDGVVTHEGKVWWFDLSCGMIALDPTDDVPTLVFEKLPPGSVLSEGDEDVVVRATRCINISDGRIVYAEIRHGESAVVVAWSRIVGPEGVGEWTLEGRTEDASKIFQKLKSPVFSELILVHPLTRSIVYGYTDGHIVGLNLRSFTIVHLEQAACYGSPHNLLMPWTLPSFLSPGMIQFVRIE